MFGLARSSRTLRTDSSSKDPTSVARTFGVGVGYQYIKYDLDVMDDGWNGNVTYKFSGPSLFAVASF